MVSRYFVYKQALLEEARASVQAQAEASREGHLLPHVPELQDVVRTSQVDDQLIRQRKDAFRSYQALTPPWVLSVSDGEIIAGAYRTRRTCQPARWSAYRFPPGPSRGGPASSRTWRSPILSGRHPGHRLHGPQLDAPVRRDQGPGDGGGGPDDPWRGDRTGVRLTGRRGVERCHPADPGWAADPRARNGRYVEILP